MLRKIITFIFVFVFLAILQMTGVFFKLPVAKASTLTVKSITWTNAVGVSVSGSNITKTAPSAWGTGGASSKENIFSGDGYVEFTTNETNTTKFVGLSNGDTNQDYKEINFALGLNASGQIYIAENTVLVYGPSRSYKPGDIFRVAVESGIVRYYQNGNLIYTSTQTPKYPLLFDTSLHHIGTTIVNAKIATGAQNITWTNAVGVNIVGNSITKTAPSSWGNGGASSIQNIISGDGYVEFSTNETNTTKFAGLSRTDPDQNYTSINYALGLNFFGQIYIAENTVLKYGPTGNYVPGDVFRVAVESGVVKYYQNGNLLYTSTQPPSYPLLFDTSLHHLGTTITDAKILNNTQKVTWTSVVGVNINGNNLTKTAINNWGNGGASSVQNIISGDGYVEFSTNEINTTKFAGLSNGIGDLSNGDLDQNYTNINFALGLNASGQIYIAENAVLKYGPSGAYVPGDIFRVKVESGVVRYFQNGKLLYTSTSSPVYPLMFDSSLYHTGTTITNALISGANVSALPASILTPELNDPLMPDGMEESILMDGAQCDDWFHRTSDNKIYYSYATDSKCSNWIPGNSGAPILTGVTAPYVFKVGQKYYLAAVKNSDRNVYLWSSTDKVTWIPENGGNKIFTKSTNSADWNYNLGNPGIAVVGNTWHLLMEGKNGIGGNYETHYSTSTLSEGPNFDTHMTPNPVLPSPSGNAQLIYVPNRNALLAIYGDWSGPYWRIRVSTASLSADLTKQTNWIASPGFRWIQKAGIHLADPSLVFADNKNWKMMLAYNFNQVEGYRSYGQLNIDQFYDLITKIPQF